MLEFQKFDLSLPISPFDRSALECGLLENLIMQPNHLMRRAS